MALRRSINRNIASEKVNVMFYEVIEHGGKRMLKPLKMNTMVSLKLVRAIADSTVVPTFYDTLSRNLQDRGIKTGTKVQLRAKFSDSHEMLDPVLKGVRTLCEIVV